MMQSIESMRAGLQPTASPQPYPIMTNTAAPAPISQVASPPFLRVSSSENGSHDQYDEATEHLRGVGASNSPPPSTFPGAGPGSASTPTPKQKRKRSMIACKNCNERRVRCDGATNGLPCSNCKHAGKTDCQFIESKRVRGARGRFESRDGLMGSTTSPSFSAKRPLTPSTAAAGGGSSTSGPRRARRHSITGTDGEEWRRLLQNSELVKRSTTGPVTYLGESWHLSWVVQEELQLEEKPLHISTILMENDGDVHNRVNKELWEKGAYVLPRYEVRDLLIAQYFEVVHPIYPILCKPSFLHSLQTNTFSHQLVQAVLMVSATHCDWAILQRAGYVSRREAVEGFYKRARMLFDGDVEPDKITNIQSQFLMQFWWRAVTEQKDTLWWLSGAIRTAQSMGLHRSATKSRLNDRDKRIWRRIWWLLLLRDRQACSHFGKPMMIDEQDCDVEELELDDLDGEVDRVQALSLLEHVKLAKLAGAIASCEFAPGACRDFAERTALRENCHQKLSEWQQNLPKELVYQPNSQNLYAMTLQIAFLAQLLLLNRPVIYADTSLPEAIRKPSETIATNAADAITKITDDLVRVWGARYMTQHSMSCLFAAMTVQMIKRRSGDGPAARDADVKLRANMLTLSQLDKILPLAGWIRRRYVRILDREGDSEEARNISISPPAVSHALSLDLPSLDQGAPPPPPPNRQTPPQMRTIREEDNGPSATTDSTNSEMQNNAVNGLKQEEDEWGHDCGQLLNMEHTLTAPTTAEMEPPQPMETSTEPNIAGDPRTSGDAVLSRPPHHIPQHHHAQQPPPPPPHPHPQQREGYGQMMPEAGEIQPGVFDYHWFMENIGDLGNPYWWGQIQGK